MNRLVKTYKSGLQLISAAVDAGKLSPEQGQALADQGVRFVASRLESFTDMLMNRYLFRTAPTIWDKRECRRTGPQQIECSVLTVAWVSRGKLHRALSQTQRNPRRKIPSLSLSG